MVTDIEVIVNSSIIVSLDVTLLIVKDHATLENLDYAHSGHTGFASTADLSTKADKSYVDDNFVNLTTLQTIHGTKKFADFVEHNGAVNMNHSLLLFYQIGSGVDSRIAVTKQYVDNNIAALLENGKIKAALIPDEFDEVMEFEKEVSGASFIDQTLATEIGSIVWCAATKAIAGDTYYRKFIVNNDGTQAGLTTIDPAKGKLYVGKTANNLFGWSGSNLLEISKSLSLGETSTTAYAGNKGKANAQAITELQNGKQDTLVSGTNIKTINGLSIVGSGDLTIAGTALTRIQKVYVGQAFSSDEITMLKNMQAYVAVTYGGGSSSGTRLYLPTNNYTGGNQLILGAATSSGGLYTMIINTTDGSWTEAYKSVPSLGETSTTAYAGDKGKANATAIAALQAKQLQVVGFYDSAYPSLNRLTFPTSQTQIIFFGYKYDSGDPIKGGSVPLFNDNIMELAPNSPNNEYFRVKAETSGSNTVLTIYQNLMSYVRFLVVETNVDLTGGA